MKQRRVYRVIFHNQGSVYELYYMDRTLMVFGDAKSVVGGIVKALAGGVT